MAKNPVAKEEARQIIPKKPVEVVKPVVSKIKKQTPVSKKNYDLDLDSDGDRRLAAVCESNAVPSPTAVRQGSWD